MMAYTPWILLMERNVAGGAVSPVSALCGSAGVSWEGAEISQ